MPDSASTQLSRVIADLGGALLRVVHGSSERMVGDLSIVDVNEEPACGHDGLLLGVGLTEAVATGAYIRDLAGARVAAVLLKPPVAGDPGVRDAAISADVTLVEVGTDVAWSHLFVLLRRLLDPVEGLISDDGSSGLFQLANEIAALVDAPITIVDPSVRVLAYSVGQEHADDPRIQTVLGRQVPETYKRTLIENGVFRKLDESVEPVYIPTFAPGSLPRTAVSVRAGNRVLGSLWAVVPGPLTRQRLRAFKEAADIVAVQLLRERAVASAGQTLRSEQFAALLTRQEDSVDAARRLRVKGMPLSVVAIELVDAGGGVDRATQVQRLSDALDIHLRLINSSSTVATLADVIYGLVPVEDEATALRIIDEFVKHSGSQHILRAGVGRVVTELAAVPSSRADADDVLHVLRHGTATTGSVRSVRTDLVMLRLAEATGVREMFADGQVARLLQHDAAHQTSLTSTLSAYLDAFGDVRRAAAVLHVHPNTLRYRLDRISTITDGVLDEPDARLAALIDLRLRHYFDAR